MQLYEKIKERRLMLNITQDELAAKLGYRSRSSINKIENGINDVPPSKLKILAETLDTTVAYLLGESEPLIENNPKLNILDQLNDDERNKVIEYANFLIAQRTKVND